MAEAPRAFVCGHPIAHSRSPLIHGYWLSHHGIEGFYATVDVAPADFPAFLDRLRQESHRGGNVTIPHKEAAFILVDRKDEAAAAIGAVNTLWLEGTTLCGSNTDAYGFAANLDDRAPGWDDRKGPVVVLGAGGAARAVLFALSQRGFTDIRIVNRTVERAKALAVHFGPAFSPHGPEAVHDLLRDAVLLVNTTPAGMSGHGDLSLDLEALPETALVTDIVYAPLETALLAAARARGLRTVDGLGMLLHQAVPGFEKWFGVRPEVTPQLRAKIEADIQPSPAG